MSYTSDVSEENFDPEVISINIEPCHIIYGWHITFI